MEMEVCFLESLTILFGFSHYNFHPYDLRLDATQDGRLLLSTVLEDSLLNHLLISHLLRIRHL
jgi:uncharacterized ubiquitin-like protein YukD